MSFQASKIENFPTSPGVYVMKGKEGGVLYIGKAKNIRLRVKQYFIPGRDGRLMVPYLIAKVEDIETIVVLSEKEALLLENTLIKKYQPPYNALLKDDKTYIALKISKNDPWPVVQLVRYRNTPPKDGLYFGPYTSAHAARLTLDLLHRLFPLRQCSDQEFARRTRPCLLYQIKRCLGPCCQLCTREEYQYYVERTIKFLKGQDKEVVKELYEEMKRYSDNLEFEKASEVLLTIRSIEKTIEVQHVDRPFGEDADAIGLYRHGDEVVLVQLLFRKGRLEGSVHFSFKRVADTDDELLSSFLMQHYSQSLTLPSHILLPILLPSKDDEALEEILSQSKTKVKIQTPQRGAKKILVEMAKANAEAMFKKEKSESDLLEKTLIEMQERFSLTSYPERIECFDNSHLSGSEPVSVMVAFTNGQKDSKRYRTYKLREADNKQNDYGAMREVLMRRYRNAKEEGSLPDLVIVDGGKGQLNIALKVFEELNIVTVNVLGLAKESGRHDKGISAEKVFLKETKEAIFLSKTSPLLFLLQRIRDEAHRFAVRFQSKRRSKSTIKSVLDKIQGIGPAKRKALMHYFGSIKKIQEASFEDLRQVKGLSVANANAILDFFRTSISP